MDELGVCFVLRVRAGCLAGQVKVPVVVNQKQQQLLLRDSDQQQSAIFGIPRSTTFLISTILSLPLVDTW